jgi:dipeptidyl-peptidase-4
VKNTWKKGWEYALVEAGYVVVGVDVAEIATQSNVWREKHYMKLGSVETQNLLSAVSGITAKYDFIDADRMAIWGWSYGGFMVLRTLCEKNHPFKCGIAVAPITDMRLYDSGYTERFMRRLQVNDRGYETSNLLTKASNLTGRLLLVHGLTDDNVHVQNSWLFVEELVRAGIIFEMQMYPDDDHFLKKRSNYEHVHRTFMDFLDRNLN